MSRLRGTARYIDHASIAALARALIENITILLHYTDQSLDDDDGWKCRQALIDLHDFIHREAFIEGSGKPRSPSSRNFLGKLQARLTSTKAFTRLPTARQKRLLNGDDVYLHGRHQAMLALGWGERITKSAYKYLSSHAHTNPLSFSRTQQNNVYEPHSGASRFTAGYSIELARRALGTGCLHMVSLFPYVESKFDELVFASLTEQYRTGNITGRSIFGFRATS